MVRRQIIYRVGFHTLAKEIRKLSNDTMASTKSISDTMKQIKEATESINTSLDKIATIGLEQADSIKIVSTFIEEIQEMAKKLNQFTQKLLLIVKNWKYYRQGSTTGH
jgi:methyl-accepting chemotaxis protein